MALPSSGQISLGDIAGEISLVISNISLQSTSTLNLINLNSANRPDGSEPHAISEFLGYDHSASSGLKPMMGSTNQGTRVKMGPSICDLPIGSFYWHSGAEDIPMSGDFVYTKEQTNSPAEEGVYLLGSGFVQMETSFEMAVLLDANGRITNMVMCEKSNDGGLPIGGDIGLTPAPIDESDRIEEDPFARP